jgi:hypothetical protein
MSAPGCGPPLRLSLGGVGAAGDNAARESFFGLIKLTT